VRLSTAGAGSTETAPGSLAPLHNFNRQGRAVVACSQYYLVVIPARSNIHIVCVLACECLCMWRSIVDPHCFAQLPAPPHSWLTTVRNGDESHLCRAHLLRLLLLLGLLLAMFVALVALGRRRGGRSWPGLRRLLQPGLVLLLQQLPQGLSRQ
jgi:hypothetical protein